MNCREVEEQDIVERYFLGQLTDLQRDEFEQHYFECDVCSSQLQTGHAIQEGLRHHPATRSRERGAWTRRKWFWMPHSRFLPRCRCFLLQASGGTHESCDHS